MSYQRTQVYLDPDDHRLLTELARRRGLSLTALVREIVRERLTPHRHEDEGGFQALIGIVDASEPTDVATQQDSYKADALDARYRKKMGRPRAGTRRS